MRPQPHIIAVPYPAQGHVIPLLEVVLRLVKHGLRVTFVNTDFNHKRVIDNSVNDMEFLTGDSIRLVSIPDGLGPGDDRNNIEKLTEGMYRVMPGKLEELIEDINRKEEHKITCMLSDVSLSFPTEVAVKLNIPCVAFWPAPVVVLASMLAVPQMISEGIIDDDGIPVGQQTFRLAPDMPEMDPKSLAWMCMGDVATQKASFSKIVEINRAVKSADRLICNSSSVLEPGAIRFIPRMKPIGPLLASDRLGVSTGHFWAEDSTCLKWLDEQAPRSVVYVAFGSFTVMDRTQFQELALGLELLERAFLWVVRPDIMKGKGKGTGAETETEIETDVYPVGFQERVRVSKRGKMVGWAPQQKVLSHPSVACFLSHCGWNSTMEATRNGIPLLCWPYFADQLTNQNYICNEWKTGLSFERDHEGIIRRDEIKAKVGVVLGSKEFATRARDLKERVDASIREGGESHENLKELVAWLKEDH